VRGPRWSCWKLCLDCWNPTCQINLHVRRVTRYNNARVQFGHPIWIYNSQLCVWSQTCTEVWAYVLRSLPSIPANSTAWQKGIMGNVEHAGRYPLHACMHACMRQYVHVWTFSKFSVSYISSCHKIFFHVLTAHILANSASKPNAQPIGSISLIKKPCNRISLSTCISGEKALCGVMIRLFLSATRR
jgi:hypothetical protein